MSPFLVLILFYLVNHEPAESKRAIKRDAFENIKKQKTNIGNEERINNDKKKGFINLINSDDTTSLEVEVTEKIRTRHSKTQIPDDDPFMSSEDIDSDESLEFSPKQHNNKSTKTDKSKDYKIEKKNIIKTSNAREVYEITVNNINKTIRYIYDRDQSNGRKEAVTPRRLIEQSQLQKFLTRMYNSCLKNFYILRDKTEDRVLKILIDSGIEYYKKEYKDHVKENMKKATNHLDQVISVLESINLGQNVMDNLFAIILIRSNNTNSTLQIENVVRNSFDKLFDAQNEYICKELGVCRSATTFKNIFVGIIDIMLKGDDDKLHAAMSAFLKAFGETMPQVNQMYQSMISQPGGNQLAKQYARNFLSDLKQKIKGGKYLIIDKVPLTPVNVAFWTKIISKVQAFMNGEIKDLTPTFTALKNFMKPYMKQIHNRMKSGNVFANNFL